MRSTVSWPWTEPSWSVPAYRYSDSTHLIALGVPYTVSASDTNLNLQKVSSRFGMYFAGLNNRFVYVDDYTVRWPLQGSTVLMVR
jgi:hypothetical protein